MTKLRDYQQDCLKVVEDTFKFSDKQLVQLPTGAGKTFIFLNYLKRNSKKALIICPTRELKEQIFSSANLLKLTSVFTKGNLKKYAAANFYIVTAQALNYKSTVDFMYKQNFDTIVIDEAHHAHSITYSKFLKGCKFKYKLLGVTATPERLDKKNLLDIFDTLSFELTFFDLIQKGHLVDVEAFRYRTGCKIRARKTGDFMDCELKKLDTVSRNSIISNVYFENCTQKKTIIFCLNIDHAEKIADHLKSLNVRAETIHGEMKYSDRTAILKRFKCGETQVLTNCQLLTEGFDEPSIEAIIIARPTMSKSLYCQMIGRGVRPFEGKEVCYLYELTDNNHNICSFNVVANPNLTSDYDYPKGIRLTQLKKILEKIHIDELFTEKEKFFLFDMTDKFNENKTNPGNSLNILESVFMKTPAFASQFERLKKLNIKYMLPISCLEADYLIWKNQKIIDYDRKTRKQ